MTLRQLEYFLSCATLLNFRKAAQLHYVSPPTLSRHISSLEEELGTSLFERDSHKVKLTEAGSTFFHTAYGMLLVYQGFYDKTNLAGMRLKRQGDPFLIGSYAFDGMYGKLVDQILSMPDYFLNRPIHIDFIDAGRMITSVRNRDIQIGIDSEVHIQKYGGLFKSRMLHSVPFHIAVEQEHPLSNRTSISLESLLPYFRNDHVHPPIGDAFLSQLTFPVDSADALRRIGEITIESLPDLLQLLDHNHMGTNCIAILPSMLTAGNTSRLHRIEIIGNPASTNYVLFWHKDNKNPDISRFLECIQY